MTERKATCPDCPKDAFCRKAEVCLASNAPLPGTLFKAYVHGRLDQAGVPADPEPEKNKEHGCRIEGRLNHLIGERDELKRKLHGTDSFNCGAEGEAAMWERTAMELAAALDERGHDAHCVRRRLRHNNCDCSVQHLLTKEFCELIDLDETRVARSRRLEKLNEEINACSLGDRPQSPGVAKLEERAKLSAELSAPVPAESSVQALMKEHARVKQELDAKLAYLSPENVKRFAGKGWMLDAPALQAFAERVRLVVHFDPKAETTLSDVRRSCNNDERVLRELLFARHATGHHTYADDGELQCSTCHIDFRRDAPISIRDAFTSIGMAKLASQEVSMPKEELTRAALYHAQRQLCAIVAFEEVILIYRDAVRAKQVSDKVMEAKPPAIL